MIKKSLNIKYVFFYFFYNYCLKIFSFEEKLCHILMKHKFCEQIFKNTQISNFMKLRTVRAKLFLVDGQIDRQTDIRNLEVAFRNFSNAPNDRSRVTAAQMTRSIPVNVSLLYVKGGNMCIA